MNWVAQRSWSNVCSKSTKLSKLTGWTCWKRSAGSTLSHPGGKPHCSWNFTGGGAWCGTRVTESQILLWEESSFQQEVIQGHQTSDFQPERCPTGYFQKEEDLEASLGHLKTFIYVPVSDPAENDFQGHWQEHPSPGLVLMGVLLMFMDVDWCLYVQQWAEGEPGEATDTILTLIPASWDSLTFPLRPHITAYAHLTTYICDLSLSKWCCTLNKNPNVHKSICCDSKVVLQHSPYHMTDCIWLWHIEKGLNCPLTLLTSLITKWLHISRFNQIFYNIFYLHHYRIPSCFLGGVLCVLC